MYVSLQESSIQPFPISSVDIAAMNRGVFRERERESYIVQYIRVDPPDRPAVSTALSLFGNLLMISDDMKCLLGLLLVF